MPLEAVMMIIDNSEYMRNGDYPPTRFDAQADAAHIVFQTKTDSNPENSVGVMTMAGKGPEVLLTHTRDMGQIVAAIHTASSKISGAADIPTAINVAQLALKHRENKNCRQRIVVFVGSPLDTSSTDEQSMINLAKKLKKNNVAVDVVCFGDGVEETETPLLKTFVDNANSSDNSHIINVHPDLKRLLSDALISSPILSADRSAGIPDAVMADMGGESSGSSGLEYGGVDPNMDPELAMAIRMSLEEEEARRAAASSSSKPLESIAEGSGSVPADAADDEETALLKRAITISQNEDVEMGDHDRSTTTAAGVDASGAMDEDLDEDEAIARAIAMSMEKDESENNK